MKRKMLISFLTGLMTICGLSTASAVYAADPVDVSSVESAFEDVISVESEADFNFDSEELEEGNLLSPVEKERMPEKDYDETMEPSIGEPPLPPVEEEEPDIDGEENEPEIQEEEATKEIPSGTLLIKPDKEEITSLDIQESFAFVYAGTKKEDVLLPDSSKLQILLSEGFLLNQVSTGKWNGTDGGVTVSFVDPDGTVIETVTFAQDQAIDASLLGTVKRIVFVTDSYSDSIEGILFEGKLDDKTCGDPYVIHAVYGSQDDSVIYAVEEKSISTTYITLPIPVLNSSNKELHTGYVSEIQMSDYAADRDVEELTIKISVPDGITVNGVKVPEFDHADTTVWVDGRQITETDSFDKESDTISLIEIKVKPENGIITQTDVFKLFFRNDLEDEGILSMKGTAEFQFSDGTKKSFSLKDLNFVLKGIYTSPSEEIEPDPGTEDEPSDEPAVSPDEEPIEDENPDDDEKEPEKKDEPERKPIHILEVIDHVGLGSGILSASVDTGIDYFSIFNPDSEEDEYVYITDNKPVTERIKDVSAEYKDKKDDSDKKKPDNQKDEKTSGWKSTRTEKGKNIYNRNVLIPAVCIAGVLLGLRILLHVIGRVRKRKEDTEDNVNEHNKEK